MPAATPNPTRPQLVGMIAALRGALYRLLHGAPEDAAADRADAEELLEMTTFNVNDADLHGFDKSWRTDQ